MVGFKTPDNVIYLADCISSKNTLDKYKIAFLYDVEKYLQTLEYIKTLNAKMFVPAHADVCEDIQELAQYNIDKTIEVANKIEEICERPISFEHILQKLFNDYGLTLNVEQYVLVGSTVKSYLSWLKDTGKIQIVFEDNMLLWSKIL
ncbi:hypothetical protein [Peptostreptococcus porci]